jgi:hypothetical protein
MSVGIPEDASAPGDHTNEAGASCNAPELKTVELPRNNRQEARPDNRFWTLERKGYRGRITQSETTQRSGRFAENRTRSLTDLMGNRLLVGGDHLTPESAIEIDNDRGLEIDRQRLLVLAHDGQQEGLITLLKLERGKLAADDANLVARNKPPRADNSQGNFRARHALQPAQRFVLGVAEQHPVTTVFEGEQPMREQKDVVGLDLHCAEASSVNVHGPRPNKQPEKIQQLSPAWQHGRDGAEHSHRGYHRHDRKGKNRKSGSASSHLTVNREVLSSRPFDPAIH